MAELVNDNDYSNFDSKAYCELMHRSVELFEGPMTFLYDSLSDIFAGDKIKGSTLLDFGTGPTIHSVISAARQSEHVYLSDFCENNRNALWRWKTGHPEAHDFSHYFKYLSKKEDSSMDLWKQRQEGMRSKVRGILPCDMTLTNPLYPAIFPQFDVITSCLCLDVVPSRTVVGYEAALKNVASLLKPGGWFVLTGELDCHFYKFGQYKFDTVPMAREDVESSFRKAEMKIDIWRQYDFTEDEISANVYADCRAFFCLAAQKNE